MPPYLLLHQVGFAVPRRSPGARCALTAPFHPCHAPLSRRTVRRSVLCGTFLRVAPTGRWPAPCPTVPGLSSAALRPTRSPGRLRPDRCNTRRRPPQTAASSSRGSEVRRRVRARPRPSALSASSPSAPRASGTARRQGSASTRAPARRTFSARAIRRAGAPFPSAPPGRAPRGPAPPSTDPARA